MIGSHIGWAFVALLLGLCIGWLSCSRGRARALEALVWIVIGLVIAAPVLLPDLAVAATPLATLLALFYFLGCPIGWWLRRKAWIVRSEAERHAAGYVFGGRRETAGWSVVRQQTAASAASFESGTATASAGPPAAAPAPLSAKEALAAATLPPAPIAERIETPVARSTEAAPAPRPSGGPDASPRAPAPPNPDVAAAAVAPTVKPPASSSSESLDGHEQAPSSVAVSNVGERTSADAVTRTAEITPAPAPTPATPQVDPATASASDAPRPTASPPVPDQDRHPGTRPPGFVTAREGRPDDLQVIRGIGPQNEDRLHRLGIWHFDQIGAWTADEIRWASSYLAFPGRIDREKWVEQARDIAAGAVTAKAASRRPTRPRP